LKHLKTLLSFVLLQAVLIISIACGGSGGSSPAQKTSPELRWRSTESSLACNPNNTNALAIDLSQGSDPLPPVATITLIELTNTPGGPTHNNTATHQNPANCANGCAAQFDFSGGTTIGVWEYSASVSINGITYYSSNTLKITQGQ
jgi:hypothetical protein